MIAATPWTVALDTDVPDAGSVLVLDANGELVCDVGVLGRSREENERHAFLVARAPRLLEVVTTLEHLSNTEAVRRLGAFDLDDALEDARELLAELKRMEGAPGRVSHGSERSDVQESRTRPGSYPAR